MTLDNERWAAHHDDPPVPDPQQKERAVALFHNGAGPGQGCEEVLAAAVLNIEAARELARHLDLTACPARQSVARLRALLALASTPVGGAS